MANSPPFPDLALQPPLADPFADPRTYRVLYQHARNDPWNGSYGGVMTAMAIPMGQAQVTPATDLLQTLGASGTSGQPISLAILTQRPGSEQLVVTVLHRLAQFSAQFGEVNTHHGHFFAFLGDITAGTVLNMRVESTAVRASTAAGITRVPLLPTLQQLLAQGVHEIGPYPDPQAPETELERVRRAAFIPPRYVPLLLGQELSPRETGQRLLGVLRQEQKLNECRTLVDWVRVLLTEPPVGAPAHTLKVEWLKSPDYDPEGRLLTSRMNILYGDLPALNTAARQPMQGGGQVAQAITQVVQNMMLDRAERQQAREQSTSAAKKTPQEKFADHLPVIMRRTVAASEEFLPPFTLGWRQQSARNTRTSLQHRSTKPRRVYSVNRHSSLSVLPS